MRVATSDDILLVEPGSVATVVLDVRNTGDVIDGVSARVIGLAEEFVRTEPSLLPLFPEAEGQIQVSLAVPATLLAGKHPLTVEIVSHGAKLPSEFVDVDVDVASRPGFSLTTQPRAIRARRGARFVLIAANEGNVPLDVQLTAMDVERAVAVELSPPSLRLEPGITAPVLVTVRGPRMITGGEHDRPVTIQARAVTVPVDPQATDLIPQVEERVCTIRLLQKPLISRGLMTVLILACIVGLWAAVFLLGLTKVFSGDPMTKQAPASFFLPQGSGASAAPSASGGAASSGGGAGASPVAAIAAVAPAGSLPKTGQMPAGTGGAISGTVTASTDNSPVGSILVQALRQTRTGLQLVSSAATQSDGTYTLGGLFPTSYYIEFSAPGYTTVWYPSAPSQAGAAQVTAKASGTNAGINAEITGLPASINGTINPGDTTQKVITTVTARGLLSGEASGKTYTATSTPDGNYTLVNLPAPGTYQLTFTTPGYQASTLVDSVGGGDKRLEPQVTLGAAVGQIAGEVTDGTNPLGGVDVTTTVGGQPVNVTTPTTGQVGAYVLTNLPTPGTYVVTYSLAGHGSTTKIIDLSAGQSVSGENVPLASGSGSINGVLVDSSGKGLGGATVTVGGATTSGTSATSPSSSASPSSAPATSSGAPSTTTLTAGSVGSFSIGGLTVPGSYTLTFTLAGYSPATVPITLSANGAPPTVKVTLSQSAGAITGTITDASSSAAPTGATVTATNGLQNWTVNYSGKTADLPNGGYLISGLQPGTYSVTVTDEGMKQQTGMVTVTAGKTSTLDLVLNAGGS